MNLVRNAVLVCSLAAAFMLAGCKNDNQKETARKLLEENTANPVQQTLDQLSSSTKDQSSN